GVRHAGCVEILAQLADHVPVARFLEIGLDDLACVGFGGVAALAQLLGRPKAEQLVAARGGAALQILVVIALAFNGFLSILHAGHGRLLRLGSAGIAVSRQAETKWLRRGQYSFAPQAKAVDGFSCRLSIAADCGRDRPEPAFSRPA